MKTRLMSGRNKSLGCALGMLVMVGAGCGSGDTEVTYSSPEPRLASFQSGAWSMEKRPDDDFATFNSIFAAGPDGTAKALRNVDGSVTVGTWSGSGWTKETLGTTKVAEDTAGDQLYSGVIDVGPDGKPHSLFVTLSNNLYYAGPTTSGWTVSLLAEKELACYDMAVGPDSRPHLLYSDANGAAFMATVSADGQLSAEQIYGEPVCGSVAVADDGTVGVVLWIVDASNTKMTARLLEKRVGETTWAARDITTDGYYCSNCYVPAQAYIPQLEYRGDSQPVVVYVDKTLSVYLAGRADDGTFLYQSVASTGEEFQLTALRRAPDGSLGSTVILDQTTIRLVVSKPEGFTVTQLGTGVEASTPRMAWSSAGAVVSYWDVDGIWGYLPDGAGAYTRSLLDGEANEGYYLGGFVTADSSGIPWVFYNEIHALN